MGDHFFSVKQTRLTIKVNSKARMHNQISAWVSLEGKGFTFGSLSKLTVIS